MADGRWNPITMLCGQARTDGVVWTEMLQMLQNLRKFCIRVLLLQDTPSTKIFFASRSLSSRRRA